jgi:hypothetical protein
MTATVTLRRAVPAEDHVARSLAALDSARPLRGEIYLALVGDRAVAALSTQDGRVVADPFVPTEDVVRRLREFVTGIHAERRSVFARSDRRAPLRLRPAT